MKTGFYSLGLAILCLFTLGVGRVQADGIIIPPFPGPCDIEVECFPERTMEQLEIRYHHVNVEIDRQVAITRIDQVFYNPNDYPVEGKYIFPLPAGAAIGKFALWADGEPVKGKVLSADEARKTYDEIVREMRDPALLEYAERGAIQANVFPIEPGGEKRIQLEYVQTLVENNGMVRYIYPLNTEKFSLTPLESVKVSVHIVSDDPVGVVYSPSHPVVVEHKSFGEVMVSYESTEIRPDKDFTLFYSSGDQEALHLLTYLDPNESDKTGTFLLLLTPSPAGVPETVEKDILVVLDSSGSMDGEKFIQAQSAARFIINHLNPSDRFYLAAFNSTFSSFSPNLQPASKASEAVQWVDSLESEGSTDINRALLEAVNVSGQDRPTYLIFLTDGLPTEGEVESEKIIRNFSERAPAGLHLFVFGVGYDVDTYLLDSLSQEHSGQSVYVKPEQALDEVLSDFYSRIKDPVITNLNLDFGKVDTFDIYPNPLPDLFEGEQIAVVGRYRNAGRTNIRLNGMINGQPVTYDYHDLQFTDGSSSDDAAEAELPRIWATRKVGYLLRELRIKGVNSEIIQQIVKLSIRYGIVTPYTSYLVTEPLPLGDGGQRKIVENEYHQMLTQPSAPVAGEMAVEKAEAQGALSAADAPEMVPAEYGDQIKIAAGRTYIMRDGIWVDTAYDPERHSLEKVEFLSDAYFKLSNSGMVVRSGLSLGREVIILIGNSGYQIVEDVDSDTKTKATELDIPTQPVDLGESKLPQAATDKTLDQEAVNNTSSPEPINNVTFQVVTLGSTLVLISIMAIMGLLYFLARRTRM